MKICYKVTTGYHFGSYMQFSLTFNSKQHFYTVLWLYYIGCICAINLESQFVFFYHFYCISFFLGGGVYIVISFSAHSYFGVLGIGAVPCVFSFRLKTVYPTFGVSSSSHFHCLLLLV